jgi:hypothetical protein
VSTCLGESEFLLAYPKIGQEELLIMNLKIILGNSKKKMDSVQRSKYSYTSLVAICLRSVLGVQPQGLKFDLEF